MNGVAREFWSEIFDLRTPSPDARLEREKRAKSSRKGQKRTLTQRTGHSAA